MASNQDFNIALSGIQRNQAAYTKAIERVTTGLRVNRAGDDPAALISSEILRSGRGGMEQAIKNSEVDLTLFQTADDALARISEQLSFLKQVAIHSANTAVSDPISRETDVLQAKEILQSITNFSNQTQFGTKKLLDGSAGAAGVAIGPFLEFISASEKTPASPSGGYKVEITQRASQSYALGSVPITDDIINKGLVLKVTTGGKTAEYYAKPNEDTEASVYQNFQRAIDSVGLPISVDKSPEQRMLLYHKDYGSAPSFQVASNVAGVLSTQANQFENSVPGKDVAGKVNGEQMIGEGQFLKSAPGASSTAGLVLRYNYDQTDLDNSDPLNPDAGTVLVKQNSLYFQNNDVPYGGFSFSFENVNPANLGKSSNNLLNIRSLQEIDVSTEEKAAASIKVIEDADHQVLAQRARLGAVQKNAIEANLDYLRVAHENILAAESTIRDADIAEELSKVIKAEIQIQNSAWLLHKSAQLNTELGSILQKSIDLK